MSKLPKKNITNPFETEDWFSQIASRDESVKISAQNSYLKFNQLQKKSQPSFQTVYLRFVNSITRHAFLSTIIMLLVVGTLGASAAEAFAPSSSKPSEVVKKITQQVVVNKVPDANPYTSLKADSNYNVSKLDECDLAIKYPSSLKSVKNDDLPVSIQYSPKVDSSNYLAGATIVTPENLADRKNPYSGLSQSHYFSLGCYDQNYTPKDSDQATFSTEPMTKEDLKSKFGWFITQSDITEIKQMKFDDNVSKGTNYKGYNQITFKFKNKFYYLNFQERNPLKQDFTPDELKYYNPDYFNFKGIFGNQVQLQFNSQVNNESNATISPVPEKKQNPELSLKDIKTPFNCNDTTFDIGKSINCKANLINQKVFPANGIFFQLVPLQGYIQKEVYPSAKVPCAISKDDENTLECTLPSDNLKPGYYSASLFLNDDYAANVTTPIHILNEYTPPSNTFTISIAPKNANLMTKTINNIAYGSDINGNPEVCGIENIVRFTPNNDDTSIPSMVISNTNLYTSESQKLNLKNVLNLISTGKGYSTDLNSTNNEILEGFRDYCSGFYSYQIYQKTIKYPLTDSAVAVVAGEGQSSVPDVTVRIFAKKGDDLIMLSAIAHEGSKRDSQGIPTSELNYPCAIEYTPAPNKFTTCMQNYVKTDTTVKAEVDKTIAKLLSTFAL